MPPDQRKDMIFTNAHGIFCNYVLPTLCVVNPVLSVDLNSPLFQRISLH